MLSAKQDEVQEGAGEGMSSPAAHFNPTVWERPFAIPLSNPHYLLYNEKAAQSIHIQNILNGPHARQSSSHSHEKLHIAFMCTS